MSPSCCGQKAKWISISPRIEYWYCDECKKEVKEETAEDLFTRLASTPTEEVYVPTLTQDEIDALFNGGLFGSFGNYDPFTGYPTDDDITLKIINPYTGFPDETI